MKREIVFALLLLPIAKVSADVRFAVYGDTRDGHKVHRKLISEMIEAKPEFVLQTGDLVRNGRDNALWAIYDEITKPLKAVAPMYYARGNHDLGGTGYEERVTAPFTSGNKLYYSFNRGNCHFISLDSYSPYGSGTPQYRWLEDDLAGSHGKEKFVFLHNPPYSIGMVHGSDLGIREALCPLFERYGVSVVFCGHDHLYYRTRRNGVTYVLTGGGGAPLYAADPKLAVEGDAWKSAHHFVICTVSGKTLYGKSIDDSGRQIDAFKVALR